MKAVLLRSKAIKLRLQFEPDNFKFAERLSKVENHKLKDNNVLIDFNKTKEITVPGMNNVTIEITSVF